MELFKVTIKTSGKTTADTENWYNYEIIEVCSQWWLGHNFTFAIVHIRADSEQQAIAKAIELTLPYRSIIGKRFYFTVLKRL